ncbi:hypothetical protein [Clostridium thermarum]|uniref:hypothetical protein n=1 Tax=Clostridium thermarum TaxID=1716543 RepID=UPI0013D768E7|nr:hypothetical protein [Clostridium thermarum]
MKYVFFSHSFDEKEISKKVTNLKLYKITTRYLDKLTVEMVKSLQQLVGKGVNDLPFLGSYLNKYNTVLVNFSHSENKVNYLLDYSIEKLDFNGTMPVKRIIHTRVECRHYLEQNLLLLVQKEDIEDKYTLCIATLLPYYLIIKTSYGEFPSYKPPKWQELSLSSMELTSLSTMLGELLAKEVAGPIPLTKLNNSFICLSVSHVKSTELKPYRKDSYILKIKTLDHTQRIVLDSRSRLRYNHTIHPYVIDEIISIIIILKQSKGSHALFFPVNTILQEYFASVHPEMYEEARLKLQRKILDDFINLLKPNNDTHKKEEDISYVFFTAAFNALIRLGCSSKLQRDSSSDYSFSYEALFNFTGKYLKFKYNINLSDFQLESLFKRFHASMDTSENSLSNLFL